MQEDTKQQIQDAFNALPKVVQDVITSSDIKDKLRQLSKAYSLHLDKWMVLENEIMMALLGITEPEDLPSNIVKHVGLTQEQAAKITEAVVSIVFNPIQEQLKGRVGDSQSTLESIDTQSTKPKQPIDISKFTGAPTDPSAYTPPTKSVNNATDPYHEPIE
jgi:hypothetical protein